MVNAAVGANIAENAATNNSLSITDKASLSNLRYRLSEIRKKKDALVVMNEEQAGVYQDYIAAESIINAQIKELEAKDRAQGFWDAHGPVFKAVGNTAVDFTPIIGDIKGFAEADTAADFIFAALGVAPGVGDAVQKSYKAAKAAGDLNAAKKALSEAGALVNKNRVAGAEFEKSGLAALGIAKNTKVITTATERGEIVRFIPDAVVNGKATTLVEFKNVVNITDSRQFRGYAGTGKPITLIVSPRTENISQKVVDMVYGIPGGNIQVYNPVTKQFTEWSGR